MEERQPSPPRNSSRTLAKVAVAVLVVIAIAGIVLASLRGRGSPAETPVAAEATQPAASAMTAAAASAAAADQAAEADAGPGKVVFAPGSVELSEAAQSKLMGIADSASKGKRAVTILGKVEAGSDTARQMELARNRANAVRGVLETHGVPLARIQIRIAQEALGLVSVKDANRVEVTLN